jgi:hypothetical protein
MSTAANNAVFLSYASQDAEAARLRSDGTTARQARGVWA